MKNALAGFLAVLLTGTSAVGADLYQAEPAPAYVEAPEVQITQSSGWYLRGVAFYLQGDYGVAIADMAETLKLEPRHFGALTQLGAMFEELGDNDRALDAYRASLKIHPHQQDAADAVTRLEAQSEGTDA